MNQLEVLVDGGTGDQHPFPLPLRIAELYGSDLALPANCVYANFVASIDGVVALGRNDLSSGSAISGKSEADRFVMGLLRACADAVLIGAGTLRGSPSHVWDAPHVAPQFADEWAELRRRLQRRESRLFVVTAGGDIDVAHSGLAAGTGIITTAKGAEKLQDKLPDGVEVLVATDEERISAERIVRVINDQGCGAILSEAGPHLMAQLLQAQLVDELFLSTSPLVLGRAQDHWRPGFADGIAFTPNNAPRFGLHSLRRDGSFLLARYSARRNS